jgi:hypothetical protein
MRKPKPYRYIPLPPDFSPVICTFEEACSYARCGRWTGHHRVKDGRWRSCKDGRMRRIVFASVVEDTERLIAAGGEQLEPVEPVVEKRRPGRPRKAESATASAG